MTRAAFLLTLAAWAALQPPTSGADADALQPPFTLRQPASRGKTTCPAPPAAVVELSVVSKYGNNGPLHDTISPEAEAMAQAQMAPLRKFAQEVVRMANQYTRDGDRSTAACALTWLDSWAQAEALEKMQDHNAWFEQGATIGGLSLALVQISPAVSDEARYARVGKWLKTAISGTIGYFDSTPKLQGSRNNHVYWAALGAAGTAVATNDRKLFDWAVAKYKSGVCSATKEGGLPLELERGSKALDYHFFALEALVPVAAIAEANGVRAFDECDGALHRVVAFTVAGLADPSRIEKLAGKKQDVVAQSVGHLSWMEIYARAFPGRIVDAERFWKMRPLAATNLGGDQTLLYGGK